MEGRIQQPGQMLLACTKQTSIKLKIPFQDNTAESHKCGQRSPSKDSHKRSQSANPH